MPETLDPIRRKGLAALRKTLGRAGMIRFLQQSDLGRGDYALERHAWVDRMTMRDLKKAVGGSTQSRASSAKVAIQGVSRFPNRVASEGLRTRSQG